MSVSLLGGDARLTIIDRGQYRGFGTAEKMLASFNTFGMQDGLVISDQMQGLPCTTDRKLPEPT